MSHLIDVLWEYMEASEDASVYKRELEELRERIKVLQDKSGQRVRCVKALPNRRALVQLGPIKEEIIVSPDVDMTKLKTGTEVFVMGSGPDRVLAGIRDHDIYDGRLARVQRVLDDSRVVIDDGGHELILKTADWVFCKEGDEIRYDLESQTVLEVLGSREKGVFALSEVPNITFEDVKGLEEEKKYLRERLIYPTIYREKFQKYGLRPLRAALFHGPPGCGKAGPLDGDILTPHGYVKMRNITKGSIVSTPDGYSAEVLEIFPQGKIDIYKVIFSDGTHTECSNDHLWCVKNIDDRLIKNNRNWRVLPLSEIMKNLRCGGKKNYSIPMTKPINFVENHDLPLNPYCLGLLLGDGSISTRSLGFSSTDSEIIDKINIHLNEVGCMLRLNKNSKKDYRIVGLDRISSSNFKKKLVKLGMFGKRSWEKVIPEKYKYSSVDNRIKLLQGLMDSGGTVSKNGYKISFTSVSSKLADDVRFLSESLGAKVTQDERITKYRYRGKVLNGRKSYRVSISMPPDINPFNLSRKKNRVVPRGKYMPTRYIDKIEYIGKKEAQCILIDHPDHLYITNNFIVTHNTMLAGAVFNEMANLKTKYTSQNQERINNSGFFVINGPSVLSKWVGNTERTIREIFKEARSVSIRDGFPSIIFWDEVDSIAGKRKDTATYTPEKTVVPTLLSEIQGLNSEDGEVVFICATNMPTIIDPALMRPGRFGDLILEIPKPNSEAAVSILKAKFSNCPKSLQKLLEEGLLEKIASHIYDNEKPLAVAALKSGKKIPLMRQEQVSGAFFAQLGEEIVRNTCISEIQESEPITVEGAIELAENIMLNQIGVLDAGVKSGFTFNTEDYVLDVSLSA
jgi:AAA+ superfamily predicted ATPase